MEDSENFQESEDFQHPEDFQETAHFQHPGDFQETGDFQHPEHFQYVTYIKILKCQMKDCLMMFCFREVDVEMPIMPA